MINLLLIFTLLYQQEKVIAAKIESDFHVEFINDSSKVNKLVNYALEVSSGNLEKISSLENYCSELPIISSIKCYAFVSSANYRNGFIDESIRNTRKIIENIKSYEGELLSPTEKTKIKNTLERKIKLYSELSFITIDDILFRKSTTRGLNINATINDMTHEFLIDTGSEFNYLEHDASYDTGAHNLDVVDIFGVSREAPSITLYDIKFLASSNNILGAGYFFSNDDIHIDKNKKNQEINKTKKSKFYVFYNMPVIVGRIRDPIDSWITICIDSGSEHSIFQPSLYRQLRDSLNESPIIEFSATTIHGKNTKPGKVVEKLKISLTRDIDIILNDTIAIFRSSTNTYCDVILGKSEIINNIKSFKPKEQTIYWNGS